VSTLLQIRELSKSFPARSRAGRFSRAELRAVDRVDLDLDTGETVALVGESGCGKTTLALSALRLLEPTSGSIRHRGQELRALSASALRHRRRDLQMVFQDARSALNPRWPVGDAVAEPLRIHRVEGSSRHRRERTAQLLEEVGLGATEGSRYPHELSGGQRQRVGIARALASDPELLIADEPVSALDVSIRGQILNLLLDLQERRGMALLLILHDVTLAIAVADRIAVMLEGRIVEELPAGELRSRAAHPYTRMLLEATPTLASRGDLPRARHLGPVETERGARGGCRYHPRCPEARDRCRSEEPSWTTVGPAHRVACHHPHRTSSVGRP